MGRLINGSVLTWWTWSTHQWVSLGSNWWQDNPLGLFPHSLQSHLHLTITQRWTMVSLMPTLSCRGLRMMFKQQETICCSPKSPKLHKKKQRVFSRETGDKVMLSTFRQWRDYVQKGQDHVTKFMPRFNGPYTIMDAFPLHSVYTIHMPNSPDLYCCFHVTLLEPFIPNNKALFPSWIRAHPGTVITEKGEEWFIDQIINEKTQQGLPIFDAVGQGGAWDRFLVTKVRGGGMWSTGRVVESK